jgi:hypothetical protein
MEKGIKLIGSKFSKLEASRNSEFSGKVAMSNDIKILLIDRTKEDKETLKIKYSYKVNYADLGYVLLEGFIFVTSDSKTNKNILKTFEDRQFDSEEQLIITNMIVQKASIRALQLEEEFNLPIHIKLPSISFKK